MIKNGILNTDTHTSINKMLEKKTIVHDTSAKQPAWLTILYIVVSLSILHGCSAAGLKRFSLSYHAAACTFFIFFSFNLIEKEFILRTILLYVSVFSTKCVQSYTEPLCIEGFNREEFTAYFHVSRKFDYIRRMSTLTLVQLSSNTLIKSWKPHVSIKRHRWWKEQRENPHVRRFGYEDTIIHKGLLPRIKDGKPFKSLPVYTPKDTWNTKKALFGQNDYIDILGNGRLTPVQVGYDVPAWLRGFRGNEFQTLLRKKNLWSVGTFPDERPEKWDKIKGRIDWLWYHLNYRVKIRR